MSAINLNASLQLLKPGITASPEAALNAWKDVKLFSDTMSASAITNYTLVVCTTGLIALSVIATLIRAPIPGGQVKIGLPLKPIVSMKLHYISLGLLAILSSFFVLKTSYDFSQLPFNLLHRCIEQFNPKIADLDQWNAVAGIALVVEDRMGLFIAALYLPSRLIVGAAVAIIVQYFGLLRQEETEQSSEAKRWCDSVIVGSLGLAIATCIAYGETK